MQCRHCKDKNGLPLKVGDKIRVVGEPPHNPVVGYVGDMEHILKYKNKTIYEIIDIGSEMNRGIRMYYVYAGGWNWDIRNIEKVRKPNFTDLPEPVMFNPENLVI